MLEKGVSVVGVNFAAVRRGYEHRLKDQYCSDRGVFVVENLCNLQEIIKYDNENLVTKTYPISYEDMTGLPFRVVAKLD